MELVQQIELTELWSALLNPQNIINRTVRSEWWMVQTQCSWCRRGLCTPPRTRMRSRPVGEPPAIYCTHVQNVSFRSDTLLLLAVWNKKNKACACTPACLLLSWNWCNICFALWFSNYIILAVLISRPVAVLVPFPNKTR